MGPKYLFHADDFGRSIKISKKILQCITKGNLNSVSIIVNHVSDNYHFKLKKLKNINKRLHLNLTEFPQKKINENYFLKNLSFFKLIFLNKDEKKKIIKEITSQIKEYKRLYKLKNIKIDGHEHVHMIPWILKYLLKNKKKYSIEEIRKPCEKLFFPRFEDFLNYRFIRNSIAAFVISFFYFIAGKPNLTKYQFFGINYSNLLSFDLIIRYLNFLNKNKIKHFEILLHPGYTDKNEIKLFKYNYFNFYNSKRRRKEFNLCFSKKIKKKLIAMSNEN